MSRLAGALAGALVAVVSAARASLDPPHRLVPRRGGGGVAVAPVASRGRTPRRAPFVSVMRTSAWSVIVAAGARARVVGGRPPAPALDRRAGVALAVTLAVGVAAGATAGAVAGVVTWALPAARARTQRRRHAAAVLDEVPEVVDLFRLASAAGLNLRWSVDAVARHGEGAVAAAVATVSHRAERGDRLVDALHELSALGDPVRPLVDALVAAERYGTPIVPALDRVADAARQARRRASEEAARAIPVKLLFPLVLCTLPALGLLTVVPVLARSWPALVP